MNKLELTSVAGQLAKPYLFEEIPSRLIPFRGDFPLVAYVEREDYNVEVDSKPYVKDLSDRFRNLISKGLRMYSYETGFLEYLKKTKTRPADFVKMDKNEKYKILLAWMDDSSIDIKSLNI